ncbi:GGDEF domain-containing protein [Paractinoplanes durhamensis]|uniref:GGDEF domain-containing protein n=1 Tax=Paractinoplanes durhamensis TaxID=113563 RepID=A0ABQ3YTJ2_9ACTN|nr:GGDEF domain-containing protein [Actinoplanes durhamensis]GIE00932.1 GGDEF domain-containing protein [Actinoplanes durhamensis]
MRFQLRDQAGASRAVAYLLMGAGPFMFLTGVVLPATRTVTGVSVFGLLTVVLGLAGAVCRWRPERVPKIMWLLAPFFGVLLVTVLNLATSDASTGAQFFYLWPVLYAANFLGRAANYLVLAFVSGGSAATVFPIEGAGAGVSDWASLTVAMILTAIVVSSLRLRNERLRDVLETQAYADPLTGVANRRSFDDLLSRAVAWANRGGETIALMTIDIDYFKKINDTWGHAVGDQALQAVADALRQVARREDDVVGRLGGDEFVVLLRTDRMGARRAADDIRAVLATVDTLPGGPPGLSIGVALLPDHADTAADLGAASDAALYAAKQGGRGRTAMAHPNGQSLALG